MNGLAVRSPLRAVARRTVAHVAIALSAVLHLVARQKFVLHAVVPRVRIIAQRNVTSVSNILNITIAVSVFLLLFLRHCCYVAAAAGTRRCWRRRRTNEAVVRI